MSKKHFPFINIGFSSIILVFATLCLVSFTALSVLTANSDYQLSKAVSDNTISYYEADRTARNAVFSIEELLYSFYLNSSNEEAFFSDLPNELLSLTLSEDISNFKFDTTKSSATLSYEVNISEEQILFVALAIQYPELDSDALITITNWQTQTLTHSTEVEDSLHSYIYGVNEK